MIHGTSPLQKLNRKKTPPAQHKILIAASFLTAMAITLLLTVSAVVAAEPDSRGDSATSTSIRDGWVWVRGDRVLRGQLEISPTQITIVRTDRGSRSQIDLPRHRALAISRDETSLYRQIRQQQRLGSPDQYAQFIQWCSDNQLVRGVELATTEAETLYGGTPGWTSLSKRLATSEVVNSASGSSAVQQVSYQSASFERPTESPPFPSNSASSDGGSEGVSETPTDPRHLAAFVRHVQPTLVNRCVRCHHEEASGEIGFKLRVGLRGSLVASTVTNSDTLWNYRQLVRRAADEREGRIEEDRHLVAMATHAHGGRAGPAITQRHAGAIASIRHWMGRVGAAGAVMPPRRGQVSSSPSGLTKVQQMPPLRRVTRTPSRGPNLDPGSRSVYRLPRPDNPVDASVFNRQTRLLGSQADHDRGSTRRFD